MRDQKEKTGGEIIRDLRVNKGFTLKELGKLVDVNYVFLSKLERNRETPSEELIIRLADKLDYDGNIDELITLFGRIPKRIEKMILDDPESIVHLPTFFKSRKKRRSAEDDE